MEFLLLQLIWYFRGFFTRRGVDVSQMLTIVQVKIMMDKRRVQMGWKTGQQVKEDRNNLRLILFSYLIIGGITALVMEEIPSFLLAMIIVHAYVLFMMSMTLITDFSSVLLDTADNQIMLPKPVGAKTLFMSRIIHILIYLLEFSIAMAIFPMIVIIYKYGVITGLGAVLTILLTVLFSVFITYLLYMLLLRYSNEQKLREIITYFQIFMGIIFMVGYQVIPRMMNLYSNFSSFTLHWYGNLLPPVWMAYALDVLHSRSLNAVHLEMLFLALVMPVIGFWILIKWLAPVFGKKMEALEYDSSGKHSSAGNGRSGKNLSTLFSRFTCGAKTEKAAFELVWKITGRDKGFRLQFYPSFAYIFVILLLLFLKNGKPYSEYIQELSKSNYWLWLIYLPVLAVSMSHTLVGFNENYQASWIYHSLPVSRPGELVTGTLKALLVKYLFPIYLILFFIALYIWHQKILIHFAFGLLNSSLCFFIIASFSDQYLPFSRQPQTRQQTGRFMLFFIQLLVMGLLVGLHYFLMKLSFGIYLAMPIVAIAGWLLIRKLQLLEWRKIYI
jgi:ABC-2 type transport system permease protein